MPPPGGRLSRPRASPAQGLSPEEVTLLTLAPCPVLATALRIQRAIITRHAAGGARLLEKCRRFVLRECGAVRRAGGVAQLRDLGLAKGLLLDSYRRIEDLERGS